MSITALSTAATGMDSLQFKLDSIANNMANASTTAFKRTRVNFQDLFYEQLKQPGLLDGQGRPTAVGTSRGLGTRVEGTQLDFSPGSLTETGQPFDLAIVGNGFFQVNDGNQILYTRAGTFTVNANGELVLASADRGRPIEPAIQIPQDATDVSISADGIVAVLQPGSAQLVQVGELQLARFINPHGLLQKGENLYAESSASGTAQLTTPGQDGMGVLRQRFLETSNTEPVRELVDLITTQRHFELNSQVVQVSDQQLQLISNLRRF